MSQPLAFSLVVNTIDRAASLRTLLDALEEQTYPHFEVIAVVGPTHDDTLAVLARFGDRVRTLRCAAANLSQSRNVGLLAARGDVVAFIDDDAVPSRRWLEQLAAQFADPALDATGGSVRSIHPEMPLVQFHLGKISSLAEQDDVRRAPLDGLIPAGEGRVWSPRMMGTNMAFRRARLLAIGGFDESYPWVYDDTDVALRLTLAGGRVRPVEDAVVYHVPASSRNREVFTLRGRWWLQTRAVIYFSCKNGRAAGDAPRTILLRCLHFIHGRWLWTGQLKRARKISAADMWRMRLLETANFLFGAVRGLLPGRRLLRENAARDALESRAPIRPFATPGGGLEPAVDPLGGERARVALPEGPLRICLLSCDYPPDHGGGVARHTQLMARGLFALGHVVHVIAYGNRAQTAFADGAYVHRVPLARNRYESFRGHPTLYPWLCHSHAAYERIRELMRNDGIQIVDTPLWHLDGLVTSTNHLLPLVVRLQTAYSQIAAIQKGRDRDRRVIGELEAELLRRADHLVANTQATLDGARALYRLPADKPPASIIAHGIEAVDEAEVRPFDPQRGERARTVLYVGRLEQRKGIRDLFAAIPEVLRRMPEVRFVIAGADNSENDGFARQTGQRYDEFFEERHPELAHAVSFLGHVSDARLALLYQSCDLFVAPSLHESFGLIYLEAMNFAKAVIGCRAGGIPEVVAHGDTGLLVDPEAPAQLAEAIVSLLGSPARLREMGLAGRRRLLERFTHLEMARAFAALYRSVIAAQAPGGAA